MTLEEKQDKKDRSALETASRRLKSLFTFKQIQTFGELLQSYYGRIPTGYFASETGRVISFYDITEFLSDRKIELETRIWLRKNPPKIEPDALPVIIDHTQALALLHPEPKEPKIEELEPCEREKAFLFWFQKLAAKRILDGIRTHRRYCQLLIAGTGYGKTYMFGAVLARLVEQGFHKHQGAFTPWPYVVVTKSSVVEQTERVMRKQFGLKVPEEVLVINIEQLRSEFGKRFVVKKLKIDQGREYEKWEWRDPLKPIVLILDESQGVKNEDSMQSQIFQALNDILPEERIYPIYLVFVSATPYTRVSEAKCFAVGTRTSFPRHPERILTNENWGDFAKEMAEPAKPEEYSPAAVERLTDHLDPYIIRVKGVKSQFKAINKVQMIDFRNEEEKKFYFSAWERYLEEKAKLEEEAPSNARFLILVQMMKFAMAAEECRAGYLAQGMWEIVSIGKQAAVCAVKYKRTIIKAVKELVYVHKVPRSKISIIWGGGQTISEKQKRKAKLTQSKEAMDALSAAGISLTDLDMDDIDVVPIEELPPELELGTQDAKQRQKEIDKFQKGESLYCFYTFRAGGVGLSLHHTDEFTKQKVRHKPSGYAYEEDIPKIPTRQRVVLVAPTYSAIEMVQGLGRCPRLTSLSDTPQTLVFYRGTIEEDIALIVSQKLKCLSKVTRSGVKESWEGVIVGGPRIRNVTTEIPEDVENEDGMFLGDDEDENNNN